MLSPATAALWTCGSEATYTEVSQDQGYQFALDDVGCIGVQKLTMRPDVGQIRWELYGDPTYAVVTTTNSSGGFTYTNDTLSVTGTLVSYDATSATVDLDSATVSGVSVCTPGTYTIYPE